MAKDNISSLYQALKSTYDLGSEDAFRGYLSDPKNREALRKELESEYDTGDSASFSNYLGFTSPAPTQQAEPEKKESIVNKGLNKIKKLFEGDDKPQPTKVVNKERMTPASEMPKPKAKTAQTTAQPKPTAQPKAQPKPATQPKETTAKTTAQPKPTAQTTAQQVPTSQTQEQGNMFSAGYGESKIPNSYLRYNQREQGDAWTKTPEDYRNGATAPEYVLPADATPSEKKAAEKTWYVLNAVAHGDEEASKRVGYEKSMKQAQDRLEYAQATGGEELRGPLDGDVFAPKLERNDEGQVLVGPDGKPSVGVTSEPERVNANKYLHGQYLQAEINSRIGDIINQSRARTQKAGEEAFGTALEQTDNLFFSGYRRSEASDPEAVVADAEKALMQDETLRSMFAEMLGSTGAEWDEEAYADYVKETARQIAYGKEAEEYKPTDTSDYLVKAGIGGGLLGQVFGLVSETQASRQAKMMGLESYDASGLEKAGAQAVGILSDLPVMGAFGEAAGATINQGIKFAARQMVEDLMARGLARAAAEPLAIRMTQAAMSQYATRAAAGAINFGLFDLSGNVIGQAYQKGDVDWGDAFKIGLKGMAVGGAMGAFGRMVEGGAGNLAPYIGETTSRIGGYTASLGGRTALLAGGSVLGQWATDPNFDMNNVDWGSELTHAMLINLGFDMLHAGQGMVKAAKQGNFKQYVIDTVTKLPKDQSFTPDQLDQLRRAGLVGDNLKELVTDFISKAEFDKNTKAEENGAIVELLNSPEIDFQTKAKFVGLITGQDYSNRLAPSTGLSDVYEADGKWCVDVLNPLGQANVRRTFNSKAEAEYYRKSMEDEVSNNQIQVAEEMVRRAWSIRGIADNIDRYNETRVSRGEEPLDKAEVLDIMTRGLNDPNSLSAEEKAIFTDVSINKEYLGEQSGDFIRRMREPAEKALKKKASKRTAEEQALVDEYKRQLGTFLNYGKQQGRIGEGYTEGAPIEPDGGTTPPGGGSPIGPDGLRPVEEEGMTSYERGRDLPLEGRYGAGKKLRSATDALLSVPNGDIWKNGIDELIDGDWSDAAIAEYITNAPSEIAPLLQDYYDSSRVVKGVQDQQMANADRELDAYAAELSKVSVPSPQGGFEVTTAKLDGNTDVYVISDNGSTAIVVQNGEKQPPVKSDRLSDKHTENFADLIEARRQQLQQRSQAGLDWSLNHHVRTEIPYEGLVIMRDGLPYRVMAVSPQGEVQVTQVKYDKGGEIVPTGDSIETWTRDEALALQDQYYDDLDARNNGEAVVEEGVPAEEPVVPETPAEEPVATETPVEEPAPAETPQTEIPRTEAGDIDFKKIQRSGNSDLIVEAYLQDYEPDIAKEIAQGHLTDAIKAQEKEKSLEAKYGSRKKAVDFWRDVVGKINAATPQPVEEQPVQPQPATQAPTLQAGSEATEKWAQAEKLVGIDGVYTMDDGSDIDGKYVLVEEGATTPSHDPHTFKSSEGYPVNEQGQNVNSRDYQNSPNAQASVVQMGNDYDGRALKDVPVVSVDGIVWSGNNRTMSGILAAENGKDGKYIESLKKQASRFGFTPEQVESLEHPRVVFVPNEGQGLDYTPQTFNRFNAPTQKEESSVEKGVKMGKVLGDRTFNLLSQEVSRFEGLKNVFKSPNASREILRIMQDSPEIVEVNQQTLPRYIGPDGLLTEEGQNLLSSALVGYIFKDNADVLRYLDKLPKRAVNQMADAMTELAANAKSGEYALSGEIAEAIKTLHDQQQSGQSLDDYMRQRDLFRDNSIVSKTTEAIVRALASNTGTPFKDILAKYNERAVKASNGQVDMFSDNSRESILRDVLGLPQEPQQPRTQPKPAEAPKTDILAQAEEIAKKEEAKKEATEFTPSERNKELENAADEIASEGYSLDKELVELLDEVKKLEAEKKGTRGDKRAEIDNKINDIERKISELHKKIDEIDEKRVDAYEEWDEVNRKELIEHFKKLSTPQLEQLAKEKELAAPDDDALYGDEEYNAIIDILDSRRDVVDDVECVAIYEGEAKKIAHGIKMGNEQAIKDAATEMAKYIYANDILVPVPQSQGYAATTLELAEAIVKASGKGTVVDALEGYKRTSLYKLKKEGKPIPKSSELGTRVKPGMEDELNKKHFRVVLIDNVYATGTTMDAAMAAIPDAVGLVYARDFSAKETSTPAPEEAKTTEPKKDVSEKTDILAQAEKVVAKNEEEARKVFSGFVTADMISAFQKGEKPYNSIIDLRKRAREAGMKVEDNGSTDIILQELVEDGMVRAAKQIISSRMALAEIEGQDVTAVRRSKDMFDDIVRLYNLQPTLNARSTGRVRNQQYSTPLPMAYAADMFAYDESMKLGLEPTAGNGMLVVGVPSSKVVANEIDKTRLDNLQGQGFAKVTDQDATEPFPGGRQYDFVIANPPFGSSAGKEYDGKIIDGLDPQIALNALDSMKDVGKAAIIIGGHMEYAKNGSIFGKKQFFTYLYDHYNVKGVIDMDGKLYSKQGTSFPTRMIIIDGRRTDAEREQTTVYPPVESKALPKAETYDDLYRIVTELINSKDKTNGNEVLRTQGVTQRDSGVTRARQTDLFDNSGQPDANDTNGRDGGERRAVSQGGNGRDRGDERGGVQRTPSEGVKRISGLGTPEVPGRGERTGGSAVSTRGRSDAGNLGGTSNREGSRGLDNGNTGRDQSQQPSEPVGVGQSRPRLEKPVQEEKPVDVGPRKLGQEKLPYRKHNTAPIIGSVAPAAMVESMNAALDDVEAAEGPIDEFVTRELGYDTIEEAHTALKAEQMDSVAMAIHQMKNGQALIIGDQTGVGKGRQMAALIRWANRQGKKPIFFTRTPSLFTDIYRDLVDIGSGDLRPFIVNDKGVIFNSKKEAVYRPLKGEALKKILASGKLPDEYDYVVINYDQVNTGDAQSREEARNTAKKNGGRAKKKDDNPRPTPKADFIRKIAKDNYLLLDESHSAAGQSNTGAFLQSIIKDCKAVTFASATFAKRPDTMPLYALRTAMSEANVEPEELIGIIEKGGVTLQEIMSRALSESGQMVRRERDMRDVKTDWKSVTDEETVKRARDNYDRTITAFNAIIQFQDNFVKPMIDNLSNEIAEMAAMAGIKRGTDKGGIDNVPFVNKAFNYTKQLLLALKVDAIVDEVTAEIKAGRHPVIALESTMESALSDYAVGETINDPTFALSLLRGLETVMQYTIKDENGNETHKKYRPEDLGPAGAKAYFDLRDFIRESTKDVFVSPLDALIEKLRERGYKVGELTGRSVYLERTKDGKAIVKSRSKGNTNNLVADFNSGDLDVLILNKSASTGISLHSSENFKDQRQRTMIIAQPLSDINDYMQMIGRIDRTGQVHRGYYINLGLPVPAESRFLMMLATKLKSLNANTTTSQDSESNDVEAPDLLNKYGSQVIIEYLRDNPEIYEKMGEPLKKEKGNVTVRELDEYTPKDDDASRITGRVALLSTAEQDAFYDDVVKRYNDLIKYLDETGTNDLKITVMPLKAKTLSKRVSSVGKDPTGKNPFAGNAFVEQVEMDVLRKPMKAEEVKKVLEQLTTPKGTPKGHLISASQEKMVGDRTLEIIGTVEHERLAKLEAEEERYERDKKKVEEGIQKRIEKINASPRTEEEKRDAIESYTEEQNTKLESGHEGRMNVINSQAQGLMRRLTWFYPGKTYLVPDNLESDTYMFTSPAIFCGYKAKDSKVTASTTLAVFATLDGRRRIEVKMSQIGPLTHIVGATENNAYVASQTNLDNWDSKLPNSARKKGYIMTGNILQAVSDTQDQNGNYPGQLISFTDEEGNVRDGILMPDKWEPGQLRTAGAPIMARIEQIKNGEAFTSTDGKVVLMKPRWGTDYILRVPKSKKEGGKYYLNDELLDCVRGREFFTSRGMMEASIYAPYIEKAVQVLSDLGVRVSSNEDEERESMVTANEPNAEYRTGYRMTSSELDRKYPTWLSGQTTDTGQHTTQITSTVKSYEHIGHWMALNGMGNAKVLDASSGLGVGTKALRDMGFKVDDVEPYPSENREAPTYLTYEDVNGKYDVVISNAVLNVIPDDWRADVLKSMADKLKVGGKLIINVRDANSVAGQKQKIELDNKSEILVTDSKGNIRAYQKGFTKQELKDYVENELGDGWKVEIANERNSGLKSGTAVVVTRETSDNLDYRALNKVERNTSPEVASYGSKGIGEMYGLSGVSEHKYIHSAEEMERVAQELPDVFRDELREFYNDDSTQGYYIPDLDMAFVFAEKCHSEDEAECIEWHEQTHGRYLSLDLPNKEDYANEVLRYFYNVHPEVYKHISDNYPRERWGVEAVSYYVQRFVDMYGASNFLNDVPVGNEKIRTLVAEIQKAFINGNKPKDPKSKDIRRGGSSEVDAQKAVPQDSRSRSGETQLDEGRGKAMAGELQEKNEPARQKSYRAVRNNADLARVEYDKAVESFGHRLRETWQDSMLSLKKLQDAVVKETGRKLLDSQNAWMAENRLSSMNDAQIEEFERAELNDLINAVANLGGAHKRTYASIKKYMIAKHGLERNRVFAQRDGITDPKDYSGLTSLFGTTDVQDAEDMARNYVDRFEANVDDIRKIDDLWKAVKAVSNFALTKSLETGMISRENYDKLRDQFDYYVPLRGWEEITSDEVYDYIGRQVDGVQNIMKHAKGRTSVADDPLANLQNLAESAIIIGNKNMVKQHFLNLAAMHNTNLISINRLWLKHDDVNNTWEVVLPTNITDTDSAEDVSKKMEAFDQRMEALAQTDPTHYKSGREKADVPFLVKPGTLSSHQVLVRQNGKTYLLTVNGNPRAAEAINGKTNPDAGENALTKAIASGSRWIAMWSTAKNLGFIASNLVRDGLYVGPMSFLKEGGKYGLKYSANWWKSLAELPSLIKKMEKGELKNAAPGSLEKDFYDFVHNGGETGYTIVNTVEDCRKYIEKELKDGKIRDTIEFVNNLLRFAGRWSEGIGRFTAYRTSREMGRSVARSIYDAKDISVNFSKKGSGMSTAGQWRNASARDKFLYTMASMSSAARASYSFFNASVQGLENILRNSRRHKAKALALFGGLMAMGAGQAYLNALLKAMLGGEDEDDYYNLPDWQRSSNLIFYLGKYWPGGWLKLPLPIEFGVPFGLGGLFSEYADNKDVMTKDKFGMRFAQQIGKAMPLDPTSSDNYFNSSVFWPTIVRPVADVNNNIAWTGLPIAKHNEYNKLDPEYKRVYSNAGPAYVKASKALSEATGGNPGRRGWIEVNPQQVQYLIKQYLSGGYNWFDRPVKLTQDILGDKEFEWQDVPVIYRFTTKTDQRAVEKRINSLFYDLKDEMEANKHEYDGLYRDAAEKSTGTDAMAHAAAVSALQDYAKSQEYNEYLIWHEFDKELQKLRKAGKAGADIAEQEYMLKQQMIDAIRDYRRTH